MMVLGFHQMPVRETEGSPRPRVGVQPPPGGAVGGCPAMPGEPTKGETRI